jgi:hypothetical protein
VVRFCLNRANRSPRRTCAKGTIKKNGNEHARVWASKSLFPSISSSTKWQILRSQFLVAHICHHVISSPPLLAPSLSLSLSSLALINENIPWVASSRLTRDNVLISAQYPIVFGRRASLREGGQNATNATTMCVCTPIQSVTKEPHLGKPSTRDRNCKSSDPGSRNNAQLA